MSLGAVNPEGGGKKIRMVPKKMNWQAFYQAVQRFLHVAKIEFQ